MISWVVGPLVWLAGCPGVQSYKLSETPINLTNSNDPTVAAKAGSAVAVVRQSLALSSGIALLG